MARRGARPRASGCRQSAGCRGLRPLPGFGAEPQSLMPQHFSRALRAPKGRKKRGSPQNHGFFNDLNPGSACTLPGSCFGSARPVGPFQAEHLARVRVHADLAHAAVSIERVGASGIDVEGIAVPIVIQLHIRVAVIGGKLRLRHADVFQCRLAADGRGLHGADARPKPLKGRRLALPRKEARGTPQPIAFSTASAFHAKRPASVPPFQEVRKPVFFNEGNRDAQRFTRS